MKAMQSKIKENVQGTNSEGKETGTQIDNLEQKKEINIQPEQNEEIRIQKIRGLGTSGITLKFQHPNHRGARKRKGRARNLKLI